ncbi:MAG: TIGR03667 family PPOX class F420-dependent oxidoreductase [Proteobacteria bacterium]|nr:TIGR03667 family PPOX class F420-dependent oxidoreductase [Pseudomonadota bacterium]
MIDIKSEFGQRVTRRLGDDQIIWLTTVSREGTPQPRPVWFLWNGVSFLIFSRPNTAKLRHIQHNPSVALNLDGDRFGGDIVVFTGQAEIETSAPGADQVSEYIQKYAAGLERIGMTAEQFVASYSVALRVTPKHLRGH